MQSGQPRSDLALALKLDASQKSLIQAQLVLGASLTLTFESDSKGVSAGIAPKSRRTALSTLFEDAGDQQRQRPNLEDSIFTGPKWREPQRLLCAARGCFRSSGCRSGPPRRGELASPICRREGKTCASFSFILIHKRPVGGWRFSPPPCLPQAHPE